MFIDSQLLFDNAAPITTGGPSTNVIDLSVARGLGNTEPLTLSVMAASTFVGGTSLQVQMESSPDNTNWTVTAETGPIPIADLTEGQQLATFDIPNNIPVGTPERYLRLNYVAVGTFTAGSVTSAIVSGKQVFTGYPPGYVFNAPAVQTFVPG